MSGTTPPASETPVFVFAVDWDGTCVEAVWPEMGDWLPGAVQGLRRLSALGKVVIHSCRVAAWEYDPQSQWRTWRDPRDTAGEITGIELMLDKAGLHDIEVWTRDFKPPALLYIDDRGYHFDGDWGKVGHYAEWLASHTAAVTMAGLVSA